MRFWKKIHKFMLKEPEQSKEDQDYQHVMKSIQSMNQVREKLRNLSKEIRAEVGIDEIPIFGTPDIWHLSHFYIKRSNGGTTYFNSMDQHDLEKFTVDLLKKSFVHWAEKRYKLGYVGLVGE